MAWPSLFIFDTSGFNVIHHCRKQKNSEGKKERRKDEEGKLLLLAGCV